MALHNSTKRVSSRLLDEIREAIEGKFYGSVEIYIQNYQVTQITERVIKKFQKDNSHESPNISEKAHKSSKETKS